MLRKSAGSGAVQLAAVFTVPAAVLYRKGSISGSESFRKPECSSSTILSIFIPPNTLNSLMLHTCTL